MEHWKDPREERDEARAERDELRAALANEHQLRLDTVAGWERTKSELAAIKAELDQGGPWSEGKTLAELVRILIDDRQRVRDECFFHALEALRAKEDRDAVMVANKWLQKRENELLHSNTAEVEKRRAVDRQAMVRRFFHIANQAQPRTPAIPDDETVRFRLRLVAEEFFELLEACIPDDRLQVTFSRENVEALIDALPICVDMPKAIDAIVDTEFTTQGMAIAFGVDTNPIWRAVSEANAAKAGGPVVEGKLGKPASWTPPDVEGLLRAQGRLT